MPLKLGSAGNMRVGLSFQGSKFGLGEGVHLNRMVTCLSTGLVAWLVEVGQKDREPLLPWTQDSYLWGFT